jgi:hypothetical protein
VFRGHLEITVLVCVTVSIIRVILNTVLVLLVDVNVDMKAVPVVQVCDTDDLLLYLHNQYQLATEGIFVDFNLQFRKL